MHFKTINISIIVQLRPYTIHCMKANNNFKIQHFIKSFEISRYEFFHVLCIISVGSFATYFFCGTMLFYCSIKNCSIVYSLFLNSEQENNGLWKHMHIRLALAITIAFEWNTLASCSACPIPRSTPAIHANCSIASALFTKTIGTADIAAAVSIMVTWRSA